MAETLLCLPKLDVTTVNAYTLFPSFLVTIALYGVQYSKEEKIEFIPPFLSLIDIDPNKKKMVAVCFGAVVNSIAHILAGSIKSVSSSNDSWGEITKSIAITQINILTIIVINYPILACMSCKYKLHASILGALFSTFRLVCLLLETFYLKGNCPSSFYVANGFSSLASLICYSVLIFIFSKIFLKCKRNEQFGKVIEKYHITKQQDFDHLKMLLKSWKNEYKRRPTSRQEKVWNYFIELKSSFHMLSTMFVSSLVIITIFLYSSLLELIYYGNRLFDATKTYNFWFLDELLLKPFFWAYGLSSFLGEFQRFCFSSPGSQEGGGEIFDIK